MTCLPWYGVPFRVDLLYICEGRALVLTSVMVLILDSENRLLMQKRSGMGAFHVPGGYLEPSERLGDAARREAREETALTVGTLEPVGASPGPEFHWFAPRRRGLYRDHRYLTRDFSGEPEADGDEGTEVVFLPPREWPENLGPPARPVPTDLQARGVL